MRSVNATGRIVNNRKVFLDALDQQVKEFDTNKRLKKMHNFVGLLGSKHPPLSVCSQCKRKMRKDIADIQITNKRENAPICIPCIIGIPRKEITFSRETPEEKIKHYKPEVQERFKKFQKDRENYLRKN